MSEWESHQECASENSCLWSPGRNLHASCLGASRGIQRSQLETRERFSLFIYLAFPFSAFTSLPSPSLVTVRPEPLGKRENLPLVFALPGTSRLFPSSLACPHHSSHNAGFLLPHDEVLPELCSFLKCLFFSFWNSINNLMSIYTSKSN